jgi:hypothetical protein
MIADRVLIDSCEECGAEVGQYEMLCATCAEEQEGLSEFLKPMKDDPIKGWAKLLKEIQREGK